jgi:hypothetical protein
MQGDPTSLERLHDIVLPAATPWWPPAPGWLWLSGFAALVLLALLVSGFLRWQHNRYRREALAELDRLSSGSEAAELQTLAELLKRVALSAWPRQQVAGLTGQDWFVFLDHSGGTRFSDGLGERLEQANYSGIDVAFAASDRQELLGEIRKWIRQHRVEPRADLGTPA